jgi:hypothetical protein
VYVESHKQSASTGERARVGRECHKTAENALSIHFRRGAVGDGPFGRAHHLDRAVDLDAARAALGVHGEDVAQRLVMVLEHRTRLAPVAVRPTELVGAVEDDVRFGRQRENCSAGHGAKQ